MKSASIGLMQMQTGGEATFEFFDFIGHEGYRRAMSVRTDIISQSLVVGTRQGLVSGHLFMHMILLDHSTFKIMKLNARSNARIINAKRMFSYSISDVWCLNICKRHIRVNLDVNESAFKKYICRW